MARKREGEAAARELQSAGGAPPEALAPLDRVQIDHTAIDLIVVDEHDRQPIGRPYLTVAIDDYSRCLLGMVVTLEAPSAVSVGLCLAHVACDKRPWLEALGVDGRVADGRQAQAAVPGQRRRVQERGAAPRLRAARHRADYRPPGRPHYGGIVERVIGTAMRRVHELPGTTFSNPARARHLRC